MDKNIEQENAIAAIRGPVILVSCPGSGKTTTLLRRIDNIIKNGTDPSKILMVTFTKAAAKEMEDKFKRIYGVSGPCFSTIHALCLRILLSYAGYAAGDILREADSNYVLCRSLFHDPDVNDPARAVQVFMTQYSAARNSRKALGMVEPEGLTKKTFLALAKRYEEYKKQEGKIDFDDMLLITLNLLKRDPLIRESVQDKWEYIQVDEYQDTNLLQRDIIYILAGKHKNLCVAGDDDQSIYGFRGADPGVMLSFARDFPEAGIFKINTNYRSFPGIISSASRLISCNTERFAKDFKAYRNGESSIKIFCAKTRDGEMQELARRIKTEDPSKCAVLYRNNSQAEAAAEAFMQAGIPYKSNEAVPDSYAGWIWQDIMAYDTLRNTWDIKALSRVIDKPSRFLGEVFYKAQDKSYDGLMACASSLYDGWRRDKTLNSLMRLKNNLHIMKGMENKDFLGFLLHETGYLKFLEDHFSKIRQEGGHEQSIQLFARHAAMFGDMDSWKAYIARRSMRLGKKDPDGVVLTTMHKAKGLEWDNVFIIDCNEGITPSEKVCAGPGLEEERRLFYVAVTRARENLTMMYVEGKKPRTRFISEMAERKEAKITFKM